MVDRGSSEIQLSHCALNSSAADVNISNHDESTKMCSDPRRKIQKAPIFGGINVKKFSFLQSPRNGTKKNKQRVNKNIMLLQAYDDLLKQLKN